MDSDKEHIDLLKQGNPLNEELKQEIQDIDGVEEILVTRKSAGFEATFHGITAHGTCDMITRENRELLVQTVLEGSMPGDNGILLKDNYRDFDGKEKSGGNHRTFIGRENDSCNHIRFFDGKKNYLCQWTWSNRSGWTNDVFAGKTVSGVNTRCN